ncbi:ABC transporter permease [Geobacter pickeringii]|uniref:ABC3 transporter permease C-terminal domain-containing protein n=1 Tax=Geobacter pickeringii TaxID=345632 RepID=A0A0B5BJH7_9BACT|nr:ABC transporter permease [Geobacter pickeringii]AJE04655.1 hypothetical protein GPICK_15905 [Geobacter pickeringii]
MTKSRWLLHILIRSLLLRRGRTLLLLAVVGVAAGLVTALGIVSSTMEERVAEELRRYGANLMILPETAQLEVGSGALGFGTVSEPAWLDQEAAGRALAPEPAVVGSSRHLRGVLPESRGELPAEGVEFGAMHRLYPWWQVTGRWPEGEGGVLAGSAVARARGWRPGSVVSVTGPGGSVSLTVAGIVSSGGDEDKLLLLPLGRLQQILGLPGRLSRVQLVADGTQEPLSRLAARIAARLPGARVVEVRQVARTSEELLRKVQLLLALVAVIVVTTAGVSVAGTVGTTVLERGKEIGLMKALGGSRRDVLLIFVMEGALLGVAGGVAGYLFGTGVAALVMATAFGTAPAITPVFLPVAVGAGLLLVTVGSVGPLVSVFRLDPVQSLRGE